MRAGTAAISACSVLEMAGAAAAGLLGGMVLSRFLEAEWNIPFSLFRMILNLAFKKDLFLSQGARVRWHFPIGVCGLVRG
jgi:hypothetical protein